jgi:GNAT superfamily N-acetyltransferase
MISVIEVRKVESRKDLRTFLTFPWKIYKNDPLWVPPRLSERYTAVDPEKGVFFKRGMAEFFIAWREGKPLGTICCGIDTKANEETGNSECVFGFFEFINDLAVPATLIDHARKWASAHGLTSLYGPFNLDYEDSYGILLDGRDRPPAILCGHTPEYYAGVLDSMGFVPARGSNLAFCYEFYEGDKNLEELSRFAERVKQRRNFTIRNAELKNWKSEIDVVYELINPCLRHLPGHIDWRREALHETMGAFVNVADEDLLLFAELDGKPIGFFPALSNFNEILIHANGFRYPWDYLNAWWYSKKKIKSASVKSILVLPEYWGSGVVILFFAEMAKRLMAKGYEWADFSLTSDDNPATPVLADRIGARLYKRYQTYRLTL